MIGKDKHSVKILQMPNSQCVVYLSNGEQKHCNTVQEAVNYFQFYNRLGINMRDVFFPFQKFEDNLILHNLSVLVRMLT